MVFCTKYIYTERPCSTVPAADISYKEKNREGLWMSSHVIVVKSQFQMYTADGKVMEKAASQELQHLFELQSFFIHNKVHSGNCLFQKL